MNTAKRQCKAKEKEAMALTNNTKPSDGARFPYRDQFAKLPDDIDELMEKLNEIDGQIECMAAENDGVNIEWIHNLSK